MTLAGPPFVYGLLELVLEVQDLDRSLRFYRDLLGLREVVRWADPRAAAWLELGPHEVLGLWPAGSGGPGVGIHGARGGVHVHFAVYTAAGSLPEWNRRLRAAGHEFEVVEFGQGSRSLFVNDPDGNVVELADWPVDWEGRPAAKRPG